MAAKKKFSQSTAERSLFRVSNKLSTIEWFAAASVVVENLLLIYARKGPHWRLRTYNATREQRLEWKATGPLGSDLRR
jgi:hypothetical protein